MHLGMPVVCMILQTRPSPKHSLSCLLPLSKHYLVTAMGNGHISSPFKGRSKYGANIAKINQIPSILTENHKKKMERNLLSYTPFIWIEIFLN